MTGLLASGSRAADVILPPTLVLDFLYLGLPIGILAGLGLVAGMILTFRHLRKRGRGRAFAGLMSALVLFGGNLAIYLFWLNFLYESPSRRHDRLDGPLPPATVSTSSTEPAVVDGGP